MRFSIKTSSRTALRTPCAIVPVLAGRQFTAGGKALDEALGGALRQALAHGDLAAKAGACQLVYGQAGGVQRVLLVSVGDDATPSEKSWSEAFRASIRQLAASSITQALSLLHEAPAGARDLRWRLHAQVSLGRDLGYRFDQMKSVKDPSTTRATSLELLLDKADAAMGRAALARAEALADGVDLARDLGNLPGNICTPAYLADTARKLARNLPIKTQVLERKQIQALRMGSFLAVAEGSEQPPRFIVMQYQGGPARQAPVVLVGKGITFDTGGISIKPAAEMDEMKYDMGGAASVLGTLQAVASMKLPINVVGLIPTCENMPSGRAARPGDIVTSMSGQTIEILNTDAEGRLILCDALTYAERFKPAAVIDIATLTGACVIALGHHNTGLFSSSDELADALLAAGREHSDPCWRMPLDDEYQEQIKSPFADMANVGGRAGGAITAACFLSKFTRAYPWAHLDIAGTAWRSGANKGSTGRPVPLLTGYLAARAAGAGA